MKEKRGLRRLFGDRRFYAMVLGIAVPVMIQNGITNFVSLLDNIMVGRIGTEQMSGVAIVNTLLFVFMLCMFGAVSGVSIFSSQYYGQRDWEGMRQALRLKVIICLVLSVLAIVLFSFAGDSLIRYYLNGEAGEGDIEATFAYGQAYLKVMLIGLVPLAISQVYSSTLREMGDTKVPMVAGIVAVLTNLLFNWLLIFGKLGFPTLGVVGAAIATVLSRYVEALIVAIWTHSHRDRYPFIVGAYKSMHVSGALVKQVAIKGMPLLINETLWSAGVAMQSQCFSMRGLEVIAATNIATTIGNLFNVVYLALGSSVGLIVGPMLGANEMEEAKDTSAKMITFSFVSCFVVGVILFTVAPLFPKLYNTTDDVRAMATSIIRITACCTPLFGFENAAYFTLRAGGKTGITFLFDSGFMWAVVVPVAFVLSRFTTMPILPLYACCQLTDIIKCLIGFILVKKGVWVNNIVSDM